MHAHDDALNVLRRTVIIGLTAFLTVVDLFATQAILPSLARAYQRDAGRHGLRGQCQHDGHGGRGARGRAVQPADRPAARHPGQPRACSSIPTALLAVAPDLTTFTMLRDRAGAVHGVRLHADAGLSRRGVQRDGRRRRVRRLHHRQCREQSRSAAWSRPAIADHLGLAANFYFFAALNLAGAVLVYFTVARTAPMAQAEPAAPLADCGVARAPAQPAAARGLRHRFLHPVRLHRHVHLRQFRAGARAAVARPDGSSASSISCSCRRSSPRCWRAGAVQRFGTRPTLWGALALAGARFAAPAAAQASPRSCRAWCWSASGRSSPRRPRPASSSRAATDDRGSASGIYLACYFFGGLVGTAVLGQFFDRFGWPACVGGIAAVARRGGGAHVALPDIATGHRHDSGALIRRHAVLPAVACSCTSLYSSCSTRRPNSRKLCPACSRDDRRAAIG